MVAVAMVVLVVVEMLAALHMDTLYIRAMNIILTSFCLIKMQGPHRRAEDRPCCA